MADYELVYARIPFGYNMLNRDRGEVFRLVDARNNEKLIGMRYILPFDASQHKRIKCDKGCGREFISFSFYEAHKKKRDCNSDQGSPTRQETAELIGVDPDKLIMSDDNTQQTATDLTGAV